MAITAQQERALVDAAQGGDRRAMDSLLRACIPRIRGQLLRLLGSQADADDVLQEVLVQVTRSIHAFRGDSQFSTWVYRITVRTAAKQRPKLRRSAAESPDLVPQAADDLEGRTAAKHELQQVWRVLGDLKPEQRRAFIDFEIEGLPLQQIAELHGSSVPTTATRLRTARQTLLRRLRRGEVRA